MGDKSIFCLYRVGPVKFVEEKDKDGKSELDYLRSMASEGWEPVSATPINTGGTTSMVMFTFKRPTEQPLKILSICNHKGGKW